MNGNKPGTKYDAGKPIIGAIPPNAELAVGRVLAFGAAKYARDNWRLVDNAQTRYMDAALRHLNAVRRGESQDSESGEHHLAHAACCVLFMLELALEEQDENRESFENRLQELEAKLKEETNRPIEKRLTDYVRPAD